MNKFYLLLINCFVVTGFFTSAQQTRVAASKQHATDFQLQISPLEKINTGLEYESSQHINPKSTADTLWYEDFDGSLGDWAVGGPQAIWKHTTQPPQGQYSDASEIIQSTTVQNGFAIFDADENQTPGTPDDFYDHVGYLESPAIDLTGETAVSLNFQQAYRHCCSANFELKVLLSDNDFASFATYVVNAANTAVNDVIVANTQVVNIMEFLQDANNLSNVKIRFLFDGTGGTSHYHWQIDDVLLMETLGNDLEVKSSYWGIGAIPVPEWAYPGGMAPIQYYQIPEQQLSTVSFESDVHNVGTNTQTNARFTIDVNSGDFVESTTPVDITIFDSALFKIDYTPPGVGSYDIARTISSDSVDQNPANNQMSNVIFNVNDEFIYARDNGNVTGSIGSNDEGVLLGNAYEIFSNQKVTGVNVGIAQTSAYDIGIRAIIYNYVGEFITESDIYVLQASDIGNIVTLELLGDISLEEGTIYEVEVGSFDEGLRVQTAGASFPVTSFITYPDRPEPNTFYTTNTPVIRLNFNDPLFDEVPDFNFSNDEICPEEVVTFTDASQGMNMWNWNFGDGANPATANGQGPHEVTYSSGGTKTITLSGQVEDTSKTIIVHETPEVIIGNVEHPNDCQDATGNIELSGTDTGLLSWTILGETSSENVTLPYTISDLKDGSYTITFVNSTTGCQITFSQDIQAPNSLEEPTITTDFTESICVSNGTVSLSGSPSNGEFSGPGVSGDEFNPAITGEGIHTIFYTIEENGCTATTSVDVEVIDIQVMINTNLSGGYCSNDSDFSLSGSPSGGTFSGLGVIGNFYSPSTSGPGTHTITYEVTGCTTMEEVQIDEFQEAMITGIDPGDTIVECDENSVFELSGTPEGGIFSGEGMIGNNFDPYNTNGSGTYEIEYAVEYGACSSTALITVEVESCLSIGNNEEINEFSLYPNPTNGTFIVQSAGEIIKSARIIDATGREVQTMKSIDNKTLNVTMDRPTNGVYIIELITSSNRSFIRFVVKE